MVPQEMAFSRFRLPVMSLLVALSCAAPAGAGEGALELLLPIACEIGRTCFVQHLVDRDGGPGVRDYSCGTLTYDGHDGVDFRLPSLASMRAGVDVLAAADGTVAAIRDGVPDRSVGATGTSEVTGIECGNGMRITHRDGWETQYCHLEMGSIEVGRGKIVSAGERLGRVGLSGLTEFPHLHFTVRRNGQVVDPFSADGMDASCEARLALWAPGIRAQLRYRAPLIVNHGFAAGPVTMAAIEDGTAGVEQLTASSPALVAFGRAIGLRAGDIEKIVIRGPDGGIVAEHASDPLERSKAQMMKFVGKRRPPGGWSKGTYTANYSISRDGRILEEQEFSVTL